MGRESIAYMSHGFRRYGEYPVRHMQRSYWEIQCVLKGAARPNPAPPDEHTGTVPTLYLFEPRHIHGWNAPPHDLSEILVIHVHAGNPAWKCLEEFKVAVIPLNEIDLLRIQTLFDWLHPQWVDESPISHFVLEAGSTLLADLIREKLLAPAANPDGTSSKRHFQHRVENARRYYRENILRNPQVEEVAQAVGVSSSQLRRIFVSIGQPPPATVFRSIQMDYARRLLAAERRVSEVAEDLGFDSLSAFSRSFKKHFGKSPLHFR